MNPEVAFAVYAFAAVIFALPTFVAGVFVFAAVKAVIAVVAFVATRLFPRVEVVGGIAVPEGMSREQFDAWWDKNVG